ncbi:hypothetical protein OIO90_001290 [Microbotryomycetes sp. JL221]|nr:hypothetical protein OIO90_001290 [Microbotryomycetes sp. JL221]
MNTFPDYYAILDVPPTATSDQIKTAYKRQSLKCHPDRIPVGSPGYEQKRKQATQQFQAVADAFYTLSDTGRRGAYDRLRESQPSASRSSAPDASSSYFNFFTRGFGNNDQTPPSPGSDDFEQPDPEHVFGSVFEELLRPEVQRHAPLWTWLGAASGAALGFIAGNIPGAAVGGFAGSRLGAVRDAKGKAVYQVFKASSPFFVLPLCFSFFSTRQLTRSPIQDLGADQKAEVLKGLAAKVFGMTGIAS